MGMIRIRVIVGVIDGVYMVWCEKSIVKKYWYWYWQLVLVSAILFAKVLVSVLAILFTSIVNNPGRSLVGLLRGDLTSV